MINSVTGETKSLERVLPLASRYGAAVIVMGFDENGQAETVPHRLEIAERAYTLLTEEVGFEPSDIIFDL